jgi:hypothetical protein
MQLSYQEHDPFPQSPLEQFQLVTFSMNTWEKLGNSNLADSNQLHAEALLAAVSPQLQKQMLHSLQFSGSAELESDATRALALIMKNEPIELRAISYFLDEHPSTLIRFRAAQVILGQERKQPMSTPTSLQQRAVEIVERLGLNFGSIMNSLEDLTSNAYSLSFDNNPLIGRVTEQIKYLASPETKNLALEFLRTGLTNSNSGVRLASSVVLADLIESLPFAAEVIDQISEIAPKEQNDQVRYYMTEALSHAVRRPELINFLEIRINVLRALLELRNDADPGVKNLAALSLE